MRILIAAVLCAVICITAIMFAIDAIRMRLDTTSVAMLGGDRVINSAHPLNPKFAELAQTHNIAYSENINFYSMLSNATELVLSQVKAVDRNYPLAGELKTSPTLNTIGTTNTHPPQPGEIWLESRAIVQLGAKVGDKITVGDTELIISAVLTAEPDRLADGFTFAPRAIMNLNDVAKTKAIVPGSRVTYKLLLSGDKQQLKTFDNSISQYQLGNYWIQTVQATANSNRNLDLAQNYLNLGLLVNVILAAITIAIAANRYSTVHTSDAAILRCLGATRKQTLFIYSSNLVLIALIVGLTGSVIGFGIEQVIAAILNKIINLELPIPSLWPMIFGTFSALALVLLFGLPAIIALSNTPPVQVLQRASSVSKVSAWRMHFNLSNKIPAMLRLSLNNIAYNSQHNLLQVAAFAIVICTALILFVVRGDLLQTWQAQTPQDVPNYFVLNIPNETVAPFTKYLTDNQIPAQEFYPVTRGELIKINDQEVSSVKQKGKREGLHRALNLTWTPNLPYANQILEGSWFEKQDHGQPLLSIENELAHRLNVKLGDELTFRIITDEITAKVSSIRSVVWGTFTPNFYVIYNPGLLTTSEITYMSSFYLPQAKEGILLSMVKQFPQANFINVAAMIDQAQTLLSLLSLVIVFIWMFTFAIGVLMLLAVILSGLNMRLYQNNLMRILGASKRQLLSVLCLEYIILGAISGATGAIVAILVAQQVGARYFSLYYPMNWSVMMWGVLAGIIVMLAGGIVGSLRIYKYTALQFIKH